MEQRKKYKKYMFKIGNNIIKPDDIQKHLGILYTSLVLKLKKDTLYIGTHYKKYNNIPYTLIVY
jgi:hypothetical protein